MDLQLKDKVILVTGGAKGIGAAITRTGVDEATGRGKLSLFVVDRDAPGVTRHLIPVEMTMPEKQYTLFFDDVQVPAANLLGEEHEGLRVVF